MSLVKVQVAGATSLAIEIYSEDGTHKASEDGKFLEAVYKKGDIFMLPEERAKALFPTVKLVKEVAPAKAVATSAPPAPAPAPEEKKPEPPANVAQAFQQASSKAVAKPRTRTPK